MGISYTTPIMTMKSIQRGTISISGGTSATATITAVTPANSRLNPLGQRNGAPSVAGAISSNVLLTFTNGTTITGTTTADDGSASVVGFQVDETQQ